MKKYMMVAAATIVLTAATAFAQMGGGMGGQQQQQPGQGAPQGAADDAFDDEGDDQPFMNEPSYVPQPQSAPQPYLPRDAQQPYPPRDQQQQQQRQQQPYAQPQSGAGEPNGLPAFITGGQPQQSANAFGQNGHEQGDRPDRFGHRRRRRHRGGFRSDRPENFGNNPPQGAAPIARAMRMPSPLL